MSTNKSIAKSAGVIGGATLISRILGFVRDIILAALFGTGLYAQGFVVAFRIPNLLRDFVGEGASNAAVVPVLVEELTRKGKERFWELSNILLNLLLAVLTILTIMGFLLARPIAIAIAPGFLTDPHKLNVTVSLTRAMFPYLIFIGLTAYAMGVLNSVKHFAAPAFGPSLLNISLIISMLIWRQDVIGLAIGVLSGGLLQVLIQIPPLLKKGMVFNQRRFIHPKVKKIVRLLIPRIFGGGIYQLNVFVSTILASIGNIVGEGAVAALYFSNRILQFPMAIFALALAQAALPALSGHMVAKEIDKFRNSINFLLRAIFFILLPASAGLIVLSVPITRTLLERGAFGSYSTAITSSALLFYAFGLLAYGAIKILVNGFYSMQDTVTPVKVAALSLTVNVILNLILMFPLKVGGLALANSISGILNAALLFLILRKKVGSLGGKVLLGSFLKIFFASSAMGAFAFSLNRYLEGIFLPDSPFNLVLNLMVTTLGSISFYILFCQMLGVEELRELKRWILRRE